MQWLYYSEQCRKMTRQTVRNNYIEGQDNRGLGYELDHKISIREGFEHGIDPSLICSVENLEYVPLRYNRQKGSRSSIEIRELIEDIIDNSIFDE
jgi:hypothetical protein